MMKPQSLYTQGMKPCVFSKAQHEETGRGWFRGCENITYTQNQILRKKQQHPTNNGNTSILLNNNGGGEGVEFYFTLSFYYEFDTKDDEVWFAHAVPYTFTDLQNNLAFYKKLSPENNQILNYEILCSTLGGSPCPFMTITSDVKSYLPYSTELKIQQKLSNMLKKQVRQKYQKAKKLWKQSLDSKGKVKKLLKAAFEEEINCFYQRFQEDLLATDICFRNLDSQLKQYIQDHGHKKGIVITSRVHPGEPQSSYMLDGMIKYLLSDQAEELRNHFVFRIVPMLNVDGVIYGNYRCSLLGVDLNRKWMQPNRFLHPTVYYAKQLVRYMNNERRVLLYCDLHGHSRKENVFFFGCTYKNYEHEGRIKNAQLRIIPLLCCHKNHNFSFKDCRFRIEKSKESTGRVVVFREFNILNSFTLECSFFGKEPLQTEFSFNSNQNTLKQEDLDSARLASKLSPARKKGTHFQIREFLGMGQQVMQALHSYLPSEQNKLDVLSGKILEIFYEEFTKLIPAYLIKREEEKKKVQVELEHQQSLKEQRELSILPVRNSPVKKLTTASNFFNQSPKQASNSLKKQRKTIVGQKKEQTPLQSSIPKHPKVVTALTDNGLGSKRVRKRKNVVSMGKGGNELGDQASSISNNNTNLLGSENEQENFSQAIKFNSSQEELMEIESFIQREQSRMKKLKERKMLRHDESKVKFDGITEEGSQEGEEDEDSSSSDSESSVKQLFTKHKQEWMKIPRIKTKKVKRQLKKHLNLQRKESMQYENRPQERRKSQKESREAAEKLLPKESETPFQKMEQLQIYKSVLYNKNENEVRAEMPSIKVPKDQALLAINAMRKSSDPNQEKARIEDYAYPLGVASRNNNQGFMGTSTAVKSFGEQEQRKEGSNQNAFFKSFEEMGHMAQTRHGHAFGRHIIPLYESPEYHQNRIIKKQQGQRQLDLRDQKHEAYEDSKEGSDFSIVVRPNTQQEGTGFPKHFFDPKKSKFNPYYQNPAQNEKGYSQAKVSFQELGDSRLSDSPDKTTQSSQLLQMLKSTYQRFQYSQYPQLGGKVNSTERYDESPYPKQLKNINKQLGMLKQQELRGNFQRSNVLAKRTQLLSTSYNNPSESLKNPQTINTVSNNYASNQNSSREVSREVRQCGNLPTTKEFNSSFFMPNKDYAPQSYTDKGIKLPDALNQFHSNKNQGNQLFQEKNSYQAFNSKLELTKQHQWAKFNLQQANNQSSREIQSQKKIKQIYALKKEPEKKDAMQSLNNALKKNIFLDQSRMNSGNIRPMK